MPIKRSGLILLCGLLFFAGCRKDSDPTPSIQQTLELDFRFTVDGSSLQLDQLQYVNAAGNYYSVQNLVFFLSQLRLVKDDGREILIKDWVYIDASSDDLQLTIGGIPEGCYEALRFNIGIDSVHNVFGGLPATTENLNMEWPELMGGGYHFMKFEGYFIDTTGTPGFAMHLGTNACLVKDITLSSSMCFSDANQIHRTLVMNMNEWFRNPFIYDFNSDGNYSMGNPAAMEKLTRNGIDVFTLE